jgi:tetratricopeptide (TPR) repeat protein
MQNSIALRCAGRFGYPYAVEKLRYKAFISYSHRDQKWAKWLQSSLEGYRVPRRLVGSEGAYGAIPSRLAPVFRDREDLSTASDLSAKVKEALEASEALIVICSPSADRSEWVSEEIAYFSRLGREDRIFALIVDGDPQASDPQQECFSRALTENADGTEREPLAADARKWADGKLLAKLKLIAGILGIGLDDLRRRDMQRRQRLWMLSMGGAMTIAVVMTVLALVAINARHAADNRREHAENLVGYMVGDLKSKLDEVGRLDILEGMGGRVSEYLETLDPGEVTDESLTQQARVWRQLGEVSMDQADLSGALAAFSASRDILLELHRRNPAEVEFVYELGNAEFWVGYVHLEKGDFDEAERALNDYLGWAYRLNDLEPHNPEWLMEQSYAHSNIAALIMGKGGAEVEQALVHIRHAVDYNRQALELDPGNSAYRSEYGEVMAWLADTQLMTCDLGEALKSRQKNVRIARQLMEEAPGNNNYKSRYAFSLTGLALVAWQVGLAGQAIENLTGANEILGQQSRMDPSNLDLRFEHLSREFYVAAYLAESDRLPEAISRMDEIRQGLGEVLEAEHYTNLRRNETWTQYLMARSDMAWRSGDKARAQEDLAEATWLLEKMLEIEHSARPFMNTLIRVRFQLWQQQGRDLLAEGPFAQIDVALDEADQACDSRANLVRQAILSGDEETARRLTTSLLGGGYFEPRFVRLCKSHGFCPEGG